MKYLTQSSNRKETKENDGFQGLRKQGRKKELLFNGTGDGYRVSILQNGISPGDLSHNNVNILNISDLFT